MKASQTMDLGVAEKVSDSVVVIYLSYKRYSHDTYGSEHSWDQALLCLSMLVCRPGTACESMSTGVLVVGDQSSQRLIPAVSQQAHVLGGEVLPTA